MSNILQYSEAMNAPELQVWNNAAFDNEESDGRWSSCLEPDLLYVNRSSDSDFGKENLSPGVSVKPSVPAKKLLRSNAALVNSQPRSMKPNEQESEEEEKRIDCEIEEIEEEIGRLTSRLDALRIEKAEKKSKAAERRGRIVPAKFLEPTPKKKVFEENPKTLNRRGLSLGPSEILAGAGLRRLSKLEVTPIQLAQNRRKSCFWKLEEIDELRATKKERGKSQSQSPKSRKTVAKTQPPKQPATTGRKAAVVAVAKKDESSMASTIQPKKLFAGGEKSGKKPARPGRVVPSRYNSSSSTVRASSEARKRSLPEEEEEEVKRSERKRMSLAAGKSGGVRGKKRWEIPAEVVVFRGSPEPEPEPEVVAEKSSAAVLPKIRTSRWGPGESPARDSGPAKRVAELVGRRSYFCQNEGESVCQELSFGEEEGIFK